MATKLMQNRYKNMNETGTEQIQNEYQTGTEQDANRMEMQQIWSRSERRQNGNGNVSGTETERVLSRLQNNMCLNRV